MTPWRLTWSFYLSCIRTSKHFGSVHAWWQLHQPRIGQAEAASFKVHAHSTCGKVWRCITPCWSIKSSRARIQRYARLIDWGSWCVVSGSSRVSSVDAWCGLHPRSNDFFSASRLPRSHDRTLNAKRNQRDSLEGCSVWVRLERYLSYGMENVVLIGVWSLPRTLCTLGTYSIS